MDGWMLFLHPARQMRNLSQSNARFLDALFLFYFHSFIYFERITDCNAFVKYEDNTKCTVYKIVSYTSMEKIPDIKVLLQSLEIKVQCISTIIFIRVFLSAQLLCNITLKYNRNLTTRLFERFILSRGLLFKCLCRFI